MLALEDLIAQSSDAPASESNWNHHQAKRVIPGLLVEEGRPDLWAVEIWDVSRSSFHVRAWEPVPVGNIVEVELESPAGNPFLLARARVNHAVGLPGGEFILDCSFMGNISESELEELV